MKIKLIRNIALGISIEVLYALAIMASAFIVGFIIRFIVLFRS